MTKRTQPIAPICRRNLLALARAYSKQERVPLSTAWRHAYGDAKIGERLKKGGSVGITTYDELSTFFRNAIDEDRFPDLEPLDPPARPAQQERDHGEEARSS